MHWLKLDESKLDQEMSEIVPRGVDNMRAAVVKFPAPRPSAESDNTASALHMVSEAAEAIKLLEEQAAEAVYRARSVADAVLEKLEVTNARAERAEEAQRRAEAKVAELTAAAAQMRNDLESLQARLAAREAELAAAEQRADYAEQHANDANDAIERIAEAIRTQLPVKSGASASRQIDSAA